MRSGILQEGHHQQAAIQHGATGNGHDGTFFQLLHGHHFNFEAFNHLTQCSICTVPACLGFNWTSKTIQIHIVSRLLGPTEEAHSLRLENDILQLLERQEHIKDLIAKLKTENEACVHAREVTEQPMHMMEISQRPRSLVWFNSKINFETLSKRKKVPVHAL